MLKSSASEVTPYTEQDKQQLLIDVVAAGNVKLTKFLLQPSEYDAYPTHSEEELEFLSLSTANQLQLSEFEWQLREKVDSWINGLMSQEPKDGYQTEPFVLDINEFLAKLGDQLKADTLQTKKNRALLEWPKLKNAEQAQDENEHPDLNAKVPLAKGNKLILASYDEVISDFEDQLSVILNEYRELYARYLPQLASPLADSPIIAQLEQIKHEKDAKAQTLETEADSIRSEKSAVQSRQAQITLGLDGESTLDIYMLDENAPSPSQIAKKELFLQKKKIDESDHYVLTAYWIDNSGQHIEKSLPLESFNALQLPSPGQKVYNPQDFRWITKKFECSEHFDSFNCFGANIPERLRMTPYEIRAKLTRDPFQEIILPETGNTLAHIAAMEGRFEVFQFLVSYNHSLLKNKANHAGVLPINSQDAEGKTLLQKALEKGNLAQIEWLLAHDADTHLINIKDLITPGTRDTLAHRAAQEGRFKVFQFLYTIGLAKETNQHRVLPVNAQDENGDTLLHKAVKKGSWEEISWLLGHGADCKIKNKHPTRSFPFEQLITSTRITLLEQALQDNNLTLFKVYLEIGLDPLLENTEGKTILDALFKVGGTGRDKTELIEFLKAFVHHFKGKNLVYLWPSNIVAIQQYITSHHKIFMHQTNAANIFEHCLNEIASFVLQYIETSVIPHIEANFLTPKTSLLISSTSYQRFKSRWEDCNDILKAIRSSVKENSPTILLQTLKRIAKSFNTQEEKRGFLGGSEFWDKLNELLLKYNKGLKNLDFESKRDHLAKIESSAAAEAEKALAAKDQIILDLKARLADTNMELEAERQEKLKVQQEAQKIQQAMQEKLEQSIAVQQKMQEKLDESNIAQTGMQAELQAANIRSERFEQSLQEMQLKLDMVLGMLMQHPAVAPVPQTGIHSQAIERSSPLTHSAQVIFAHVATYDNTGAREETKEPKA